MVSFRKLTFGDDIDTLKYAKIGTGGFADVYKVNDRAVKVFTNAAVLVKEVKCLHATSEISVHMYDFGVTDIFSHNGTMEHCIVMELMQCDLLDLLMKTSISENYRISYLRQLCRAVNLLHSRGIAHLDIKLENCLISGKSLEILKISDFNLSHMYTNFSHDDDLNSAKFTVRGQVGSLPYAAPEVLVGKKFNGFSADKWSVGICVWALSFNCWPFRSASLEHKNYELLTQKNSIRAIIHTDLLNLRSSKYNNIIIQFMEGCMRIPAEERALNSNLLVPITKTSSGGRDQTQKENATENII